MIVKFEGSDPWKGSRWKMQVDLAEICKLEGKKETIYDGKKRYAIVYPKSKARKLFRLMIENIHDDSILDGIEKYLKGNSDGYGKLFHEIREKIGR